MTSKAQDIDGLGSDPLTTDTPVDGGLSLLLAAGAAYGVRKYRQQKKGGAGRASDRKGR